ncbi:MAG: amidohydrolase family protein, partial [Flavobacteriales bacterium]|nr:amidohydrolase family protein [Flavobacteriales bacterium]
MTKKIKMVQNQILQYRTTRLLLLAFTAGALLQSCYKGEEADLVVHNANIYSIDDNFSAYNAMAITDGKIVALGAEREILNKYSAKEKVDARKMTVFPGFYDAHSHFLGSANNRGEINLFETESFDDVLDRVGDFAKTSDRNWLVGRGWDQNTWPEKSFPDKTQLDEFFPDRPVFLTRVDGHAALVNQAALDLAGIDQNTKISGGKIEKTEGGDLTGILIDRATELMEAVVEPLDREERLKLIAEAEQACIEAGLTTVTDAGLSVADVLFIDSLHKSGELKLGVYAMFNPNAETLEQMEQGPILSDRLTARSVKLYSDGALGSRGALLKEPYADDPENYGIQLLTDSVFDLFATACLENDFQLNTHCIGDSANAHVLKLYKSVLERMNDR